MTFDKVKRKEWYVLKTVANIFEMSVDDILTHKREMDKVYARCVATHIFMQLGYKQIDISPILGYQHKKSIYYLVKMLRNREYIKELSDKVKEADSLIGFK